MPLQEKLAGSIDQLLCHLLHAKSKAAGSHDGGTEKGGFLPGA